jgi:hypothetical protein
MCGGSRRNRLVDVAGEFVIAVALENDTAAVLLVMELAATELTGALQGKRILVRNRQIAAVQFGTGVECKKVNDTARVAVNVVIDAGKFVVHGVLSEDFASDRPSERWTETDAPQREVASCGHVVSS